MPAIQTFSALTRKLNPGPEIRMTAVGVCIIGCRIDEGVKWSLNIARDVSSHVRVSSVRVTWLGRVNWHHHYLSFIHGLPKLEVSVFVREIPICFGSLIIIIIKRMANVSLWLFK